MKVIAKGKYDKNKIELVGLKFESIEEYQRYAPRIVSFQKKSSQDPDDLPLHLIPFGKTPVQRNLGGFPYQIIDLTVKDKKENGSRICLKLTDGTNSMSAYADTKYTSARGFSMIACANLEDKLDLLIHPEEGIARIHDAINKKERPKSEDFIVIDFNEATKYWQWLKILQNGSESL